MCPISGLVQFLIVVVTVLLMCHALVANCAKVTFKPENVTLHMYDQATIEYEVEGKTLNKINIKQSTELNFLGEPGEEFTFQLYSKDDNIAEVENNIELKYPDDAKGQFNITGNFLGKTVVTCKTKNYQSTLQDCNMDVIVIRKKRVIDTIFTASVATLVSIIYVNFGCALNWGELRKSLKRPIGPVLGFIGQFLFMPLVTTF